MYSYILTYLRQLDNSIRHLSNSTSCDFLANTLILIFLLCPTLFSVWAWDMQKVAAISKIFDNDTGTAVFSHMFDKFLQKFRLKRSTLFIVYSKIHT